MSSGLSLGPEFCSINPMISIPISTNRELSSISYSVDSFGANLDFDQDYEFDTEIADPNPDLDPDPDPDPDPDFDSSRTTTVTTSITNGEFESGSKLTTRPIPAHNSKALKSKALNRTTLTSGRVNRRSAERTQNPTETKVTESGEGAGEERSEEYRISSQLELSRAVKISELATGVNIVVTPSSQPTNPISNANQFDDFNSSLQLPNESGVWDSQFLRFESTPSPLSIHPPVSFSSILPTTPPSTSTSATTGSANSPSVVPSHNNSKRVVQVFAACNHCYDHKVSCCGSRPCERCCKFNRAETCRDREKKTNKRAKKDKDHSTSGAGSSSPLVAIRSEVSLGTVPRATTSIALSHPHAPSLSTVFNNAIRAPNLAATTTEPVPTSPAQVCSGHNFRPTLPGSALLLYLLKSTYLVGELPCPIGSLLPFLSLLKTQLEPEDFGSFLQHLGYVYATSIDTDIQSTQIKDDFKLSSFIPPTNSSSAKWKLPPLPHDFIQSFNLSPLVAVPDPPPPYPHLAMMFIGNQSTLHTLLDLPLQLSPTSNDMNHQRNELQQQKELSRGQEQKTRPQSSIVTPVDETSSFVSESIVVVNREFERLFGYTQAEIRSMFINHGMKSVGKLFDRDSINAAYYNGVVRPCGLDDYQQSFICFALTKWGSKLKVTLKKTISTQLDLYTFTSIVMTNISGANCICSCQPNRVN